MNKKYLMIAGCITLSYGMEYTNSLIKNSATNITAYECSACCFFTENYSVWEKHRQALQHKFLTNEDLTDQEKLMKKSWDSTKKRFCCPYCDTLIKKHAFSLSLYEYVEHLSEHSDEQCAIKILFLLKHNYKK